LQKLDLIATAPFGLEAVVAREVKELGYGEVTVENGKVSFKAGAEGVCRSNLWLRTADRVHLKMGEFKATSFEELFQGIRELPWEDILPENAAFPVQGKSVKSKLFSVPHCQAIVKKAIVERMKNKYRREWFPEDGALYHVEVSLLKDMVTVTLDTSGVGLHKRGYRGRAGEAPLKETLAAGMILLSRWHPDTALIDPFCGSGTIPIEAAFLGMNLAPGLQRSFIAENWPFLPQKLWDRARQEAREKASPGTILKIAGSDLNPEAVELARQNAARAGVAHGLRLENRPFSELKSSEQYGKIVCNPPYGEREGEIAGAKKLYRDMGRVFSCFPTWSFYVLTSMPGFEKLLGRKASKRRKLYNGRIEVHYYQYFGPRPSRESGCQAGR